MIMIKLFSADQNERIGVPGRSYVVTQKIYEKIRYAIIEIEVERSQYESYYICNPRDALKLPEPDIKGCSFSVAFITNELNRTIDKVGPYE